MRFFLPLKVLPQILEHNIAEGAPERAFMARPLHMKQLLYDCVHHQIRIVGQGEHPFAKLPKPIAVGIQPIQRIVLGHSKQRPYQRMILLRDSGRLRCMRALRIVQQHAVIKPASASCGKPEAMVRNQIAQPVNGAAAARGCLLLRLILCILKKMRQRPPARCTDTGGHLRRRGGLVERFCIIDALVRLIAQPLDYFEVGGRPVPDLRYAVADRADIPPTVSGCHAVIEALRRQHCGRRLFHWIIERNDALHMALRSRDERLVRADKKLISIVIELQHPADEVMAACIDGARGKPLFTGRPVHSIASHGMLAVERRAAQAVQLFRVRKLRRIHLSVLQQSLRRRLPQKQPLAKRVEVGNDEQVFCANIQFSGPRGALHRFFHVPKLAAEVFILQQFGIQAQCFLCRRAVRIVCRCAKALQHAPPVRRQLFQPGSCARAQAYQLAVGQVGQRLQHLVADACARNDILLHVAHGRPAAILPKQSLILLPAFVIPPHLELAPCKDDLDVFGQNVVFNTINIAHRSDGSVRLAVLANKRIERKRRKQPLDPRQANHQVLTAGDFRQNHTTAVGMVDQNIHLPSRDAVGSFIDCIHLPAHGKLHILDHNGPVNAKIRPLLGRGVAQRQVGQIFVRITAAAGIDAPNAQPAENGRRVRAKQRFLDEQALFCANLARARGQDDIMRSGIIKSVEHQIAEHFKIIDAHHDEPVAERIGCNVQRTRQG